MPIFSDLLGDPAAICNPAFDPRNYSVLDITLGAPQSSLADWEVPESNQYGWRFIDGGVRVRVINGIIAEISLPQNFLARLDIHSTANLLKVFGSPDSKKEISYKGRATVVAHVWNRGFLVWCDALEDKFHRLSLFDPSKPVPIHNGEKPESNDDT